MRLVGTKLLEQGSILAMPVSTSGGKVVLNSGVVLTDTYIEKIKNLGIFKLYIKDDRFSDIEPVGSIDIKTWNTTAQVIKDSHAVLHKGKEIDEYPIKDCAKKIVDNVRELKDKGVSLLSLSAIDEYITEHSINVAILSAFIANRMNFNFNQLCDLVTGALIHDLGRENVKEEKPEHAQKGFDAMRKCRGLSTYSTLTCYEHHENYDGSGYPRKIKGNVISEFTRVIRVADLYDNELHGYDNDDVPLMPHQAFENILAVTGRILDPEVVKVFRDTIVFYPNGCSILLSNGLKGVVIKQNYGSPQRPIVRIYNDTSILGEIDLMKSLTIFIKDVEAM
jgi:HD-GYP domain-containing protein (c-di-GMP phosphodiesterase class II)